MLLGLAIASADARGEPEVEDQRISTAFLELRARIHRGLVDWAQFGGGITAFGDRYLLATRTGELYVFGWAPDTDVLRFDPLPHRIPLNAAEFEQGAGEDVSKLWFRVVDVVVQQSHGRLRLFVSHHRWKKDEGCFVARVSSIEGSLEDLLDGSRELEWRPVFDTQPCLRIQHGNRGHPFQGNHIGGRMWLIDEHHLLLTVGDHGFDGWNAEPILPQDPGSSYGKTLQIDIDSGASEIISMGHRNPQGLYIDDDGSIWLTEHGPTGGDELNRIQRGANYGWPHVTYGTAANRLDWPLSKKRGSHDGYEQPFYSWTPSIGVSNLIVVRGDQFALWRGDLLVAALADTSVRRLRIRENRVVYTERIPLGRRIRDIAQGADGRIVLWTDHGELISLQPSAGR